MPLLKVRELRALSVVRVTDLILKIDQEVHVIRVAQGADDRNAAMHGRLVLLVLGFANPHVLDEALRLFARQALTHPARPLCSPV